MDRIEVINIITDYSDLPGYSRDSYRVLLSLLTDNELLNIVSKILNKG